MLKKIKLINKLAPNFTYLKGKGRGFASVNIPSSEETTLRKELALCYRVCHHEGLNEGTDNHLSVQLETNSQKTYLTLPYGILWSTVKPEDFVLVDASGNVLRQSEREGYEDAEPDISAIKIHGSIH